MAGQLLPFDGLGDKRLPKELAKKMGKLPRSRKCPDQEDIGANYVGACSVKTRDPDILLMLFKAKIDRLTYLSFKPPPSP